MRLIIPFDDSRHQYGSLRDDVLEAIRRVADQQRFTLGPEVTELEQLAAEFCGGRYAVGTSSGTDALLLALMAAGVGSGHDVITTAYSDIASADVIVRVGARPVFVDIEPHSFNIDPDAAVAAITPRTRAIIAVHLFGRCADLDPALLAAKARGIAIIEDAAQALGARDDRGRSAGSLGDMAAFSFGPHRNVGGFGEAGLIVTSNTALNDRLRSLRVHGAVSKNHYRYIGGNFRLDALQAAILRLKLPHALEWADMRRTRAERYRVMFAAAGLLDHLVVPADVLGHVYSRFTIRCKRRNALRAYLRAHEVGTDVCYPLPLPLQECFAPLGHRKGDFPVADAAARTALALPLYPDMTEDQQAYVVDSVKQFYAQPNDSDGSGEIGGGPAPARQRQRARWPKSDAAAASQANRIGTPGAAPTDPQRHP